MKDPMMLKQLFFVIVLSISLDLAAQDQEVVSNVYRWNDLKAEKVENRVRRQVLKGTTRDLEVLEIHASTVEPAQSPHASHTHDDVEELIIVREGKLKVTIKDQTRVLGPGSVALAIPGEEHGFFNAGDGPVTYYIMKYKSKLPADVERGKKNGGSFMIDWNDLQANKTEKGVRRNFFDHPTSMTNRFEMHVTMLNEGQNSHVPHTHRAEEILVIIRGNVSMQIGERHEKASAGDLVFLGSEVPHALTNIGNSPCEYFAFQW
jgi:(S)-ureidoglycine aminohydrolase